MTDLVGKRVRVKDGYTFEMRNNAGRYGAIVEALSETTPGRTLLVEFAEGDSVWFYAHELEVLDASNPPT